MELPFPAGKPVRGRNLVGREKEIKKILDLTETGQSVILIAPRKYGKTSVLLEVLSRIKKKGLLCARVDIFQTATKKELAERITESVLNNKRMPFNNTIKAIKSGLGKALKHIELKQVVKDFEFIVNFADSRIDESVLLDNALDFPQEFARKQKTHLVLAFDEFGDLLKLNGEALIKRMRSRFQLQEDVTYLFTGSQESIMEKLFANKKQAFYRFGRIIYLPELPKLDLSKYIAATFSRLGFYIADNVVDKIIHSVGAHPYYSQLVCQLLYLTLKGEKKEINEKDAAEAFIRAVYSEKSYFDQIWFELMETRHLIPVLKGIVLEGESPYKIEGLTEHNLYRSLSALENKGIIKKISRGRYRMRDLLFKEYINLKEKGEI